MKKYINERDGQLDFYNSIIPRVNKNLSIEAILEDYTDGIINGNILEFKLQINDVSKTLFQAIKYLSARRIKGKEVPRNIMLVSLNDAKLYLFKSEDYLMAIEKPYFSSASTDNTGFLITKEAEVFRLDNELHVELIIKHLKTDYFTKINIDDNCIIGWAERFYHEKPEAKKQDFIGDLEGTVKIKGEIRRPTIFKNYINVYMGATNIKFRYLMDQLNDSLMQKNLGAFYTPKLYAEKSLELLRQAIARVPVGNDYIILDRCAGTGNLEQFLSDDELSHTIVSTLEYYEYKVLMEHIGDKVRHIIPPLEVEDTFNQGLVTGADALSKEYLENPVIMQYVNNEKCTIILFENPPYAESNGTTKINSGWKNTHVLKEMKKNNLGEASNDLANAFIWSAFRYYLRQDTDSYVVFSPIKYWKGQQLIDNKFIDGFTFNRKHFHTKTAATISCGLWSNEKSSAESITFKAFDIINDELIYQGEMIAHKCFAASSKFYPKKTYNDLTGIALNLNGTEYTGGKKRVKTVFDKDVIAYVVANGNGFDNPRLNSSIVRVGRYDGNGDFLDRDNYFYTLPILSAGKYTDHINDWKIMSFTMRTSDGYDNYIQDYNKGALNEYLLKTLLWTSLTHYSKIRSLNGSDGRFYRNELCLDTTHGATVASEKLKELQMNEEELLLICAWESLLIKIKQTSEYNDNFTYGLYQIDEELNTKYKDENDKTVYNYPELNGDVKSLKKLVKNYYVNNLVDTLFKYEFLK